MSSNYETTELKAGHPPAVKVGGMRITQHKIKDNNEKCEVKSENHDDDEVTSSSPPKEKPQNLVICGSVTRGDADFPPAAIQAYHNKPLPSHEFRNNNPKNNIIQQPRK